jgi:2-methylcitrate dehydratase PrpD
MSDPTETLAAFFCGTGWEQVPSAVVDRSLWAFADTIAVAVAGHRIAGAKVMALAGALGAYPQTRILASDRRTSVSLAALADGVLAHAMDDDLNPSMGGHPGAPVLSAALPLAEMLEASGRNRLLV